MQGRVIIPEALKTEALQMLHEIHEGVVRMKQLARRYVFWPGLNKDIEKVASSCSVCKENNVDTAPRSYIPWSEAKKPFDRIHLDFFHWEGRNFLLVVDAFSRWIEVVKMRKTDAPALIDVLQGIFSRFGDTVMIVADNGPPFASREVEGFLENRDITT